MPRGTTALQVFTVNSLRAVLQGKGNTFWASCLDSCIGRLGSEHLESRTLPDSFRIHAIGVIIILSSFKSLTQERKLTATSTIATAYEECMPAAEKDGEKNQGT